MLDPANRTLRPAKVTIVRHCPGKRIDEAIRGVGAWILGSFIVIGAAGCKDSEIKVFGAGATAPASLYHRGAEDFHQKHPRVQVIYDSLGSQRGVEFFLTYGIDFAATEIPVLDGLEQRYQRKFRQIPLTIGVIVLAINVENIRAINLSRDVVADIFLGEITNWSDPRIATLNPEITLPDLSIVPIHRSDGSGTTYTFTKFLSLTNDAWRKRIGSGATVRWPTLTGSLGTSGMMQTIRYTPGAIGYLTYNALINHVEEFALANVENYEGKHIQPSVVSIKEAVRNAEIGEIAGMNAKGKHSYPIVMTNYALVRSQYVDPLVTAALKDYLLYGLSRSSAEEYEYGFSRLPEPTLQKAREMIHQLSPSTAGGSKTHD